MDHCYSHSIQREVDLIPIEPKDRGSDHSYSNNRENFQYKDHSYFQFAKKTPPIHHFRLTLYREKCDQSTPLVSLDHTYVRALQLCQIAAHSNTTGAANHSLMCKLCSSIISDSWEASTRSVKTTKDSHLLATDLCSLGSLCHTCASTELSVEVLSDHSYNQLDTNLPDTARLQLTPEKITSWSDHTYMTFV
ncbi:hypothetical protein LSH36_3g11005 [Paralvinella palmiformis]|uniref:Uncharacterized protein n=1 Tax=Paralvinella palmiformis TaxID=53620 RepID=A0AAD9KGU1_9ANNE|nr:hypothetical protein LSH36_3g11005 [Paralvinella palmiformis]